MVGWTIKITPIDLQATVWWQDYWESIL